MAGFSSIDDMVNEITTNGKSSATVFSKTSSNTATSAAGRWHEFFTATNIPAAGAFTGSAGVGTQALRSVHGGIDHGAAVSPDFKHILNTSIYTSSSVIAPATAILCDLLFYYPACVITGTPTTLTNPASLPRYTTGDGVYAMVAVQTLNGAASPAITLTYTDSDGNASNVASAVTAPSNSSPISIIYQNNGSPWVPMVANDRGVRSVQSYSLASGTTGTIAICLVKPLLYMPIITQSIVSERDLLYQMPSLPRVYDDACLFWMMQTGGGMTASQTIMGQVTFGWG